MKNNYQELVGEVFCDVLEKLAFMFAEAPDDTEAPEIPAHCVRTGIDFTGIQTGSLSLIVPQALCPEIAANMLGVEEEDELAEERAIDALKELLNVTCGHVLTRLASEEAVFDLSVPSVNKLDLAGWEERSRDPDTLILVVDDVSPVLLRLTVNE